MHHLLIPVNGWKIRCTWGPLQLKPLTGHPVSKVGTQQIQRLPCGMGWGSILLKPMFLFSAPFVYVPRDLQNLSRTSMYLCVVYREGVSWVILKPESSDDAMRAHCYPRCASHRVERPLQDHVGRIASPVDIVLPADMPREVELCFIQNPNVSQKVRNIFNHVGDQLTHFHSLLNMSSVSFCFTWIL